jgi:hypothetical protein
MTDYLLANGTNKAPAVRAPAHMASWLEARGYRIVRSPSPGSVDPGDRDLVARIAAGVDWTSGEDPSGDEDGRLSIVRQVLAAVSDRSAPAGSAAVTDIRRAA